MAPRLGATFATGAFGPVYYAGQCLLSRRAEEGLKQLTVESLRGGVKLGAAQAAALVGMSGSDVERLLPMAELEQILAKIAVSQPKVIEAWKMYAGGLGGLLTGVADLTVDGRAPDTALCVARLAKKVQRDKPLSVPLQALADDLEAWQEALHRCVAMLEDTTALQKAYQRRRMRRLGAIGGGALVAVVAVVSIAWVVVARARVVAVIEDPDPCASMALTPDDLDRVSPENKARGLENRAKCEAARAAEARRAEEERQREEREREAKKAKEALEASCAALLAHVEQDALDNADVAFLKDAGPFYDRVAKGALDLADYGPAEPATPCKGTKSEAGLTAAFRKAVLAKPWNAPKVESTSRAVREALASGADGLPPKLKMMMGKIAADTARKALVAGKVDQLMRAAALCDAAKAVGTEPEAPCRSVRALQQQ